MKKQNGLLKKFTISKQIRYKSHWENQEDFFKQEHVNAELNVAVFFFFFDKIKVFFSYAQDKQLNMLASKLKYIIKMCANHITMYRTSSKDQTNELYDEHYIPYNDEIQASRAFSKPYYSFNPTQHESKQFFILSRRLLVWLELKLRLQQNMFAVAIADFGFIYEQSIYWIVIRNFNF